MSPNARGEGGVAASQPMSIQLYTGAQINFGHLTPYLTFGYNNGFVIVYILILFFLASLLLYSGLILNGVTYTFMSKMSSEIS
jgi:hypothetical protein